MAVLLDLVAMAGFAVDWRPVPGDWSACSLRLL